MLYHSMAYTDRLLVRLTRGEACGVSERVSSGTEKTSCSICDHSNGDDTRQEGSSGVGRCFYWMQAGVVLLAAVVCVAFASARTSARSRREVTRGHQL